jgi:hypothetical protein
VIAVTVRYKNNNMADITMCNGMGCNARSSCYRHTAKPDEYTQPYFLNEPMKENVCVYYINNENKKQ